jgi:hypothetical protein
MVFVTEWNRLVTGNLLHHFERGPHNQGAEPRSHPHRSDNSQESEPDDRVGGARKELWHLAWRSERCACAFTPAENSLKSDQGAASQAPQGKKLRFKKVEVRQVQPYDKCLRMKGVANSRVTTNWIQPTTFDVACSGRVF